MPNMSYLGRANTSEVFLGGEKSKAVVLNLRVLILLDDPCQVLTLRIITSKIIVMKEQQNNSMVEGHYNTRN